MKTQQRIFVTGTPRSGTTFVGKVLSAPVQLVKTVLNLPLSYRLRGSTDKWLLKEIASRYLPRNIVYRKKVGFPLPLRDYLAPLAQAELFRGGFCLEVVGLQPRGFKEAISNWSRNVHGFFNLLALEI